MIEWDENESPEEEERRLKDWLIDHRCVWYIGLEMHGKAGEAESEEMPYFAGTWKIEQDYDEDVGQMIMAGYPDFPMETPVRVEIHQIPQNERPDQYQPHKYLEYAFSHVLVIRAMDRTIENKRKEGNKTIISLDQGERINHLRLSGRLDDF